MQTRPGLLFLIFLPLMAGVLIPEPAALAEDVVVTKNQVFRGKVTDADGNTVTIEMLMQGKQQKMVIPRDMVVSMTVEPPPSVTAGIEAYEQGDWKKAKLNLEKIILNYQGLDVGWAQEGVVHFGRASLLAGDYANAERAFTSFLKLYPDHELVIEAKLGQAEIERSKKNYDAALEQFRAMAVPYDKVLRPARSELPYAAEIYLGIGKCLEAKSDMSGALHAYVRSIALYPDERIYPEALYRSAVVFSEMNRFDKAGLYLSELIKEYPATEFAKQGIQLRNSIEAKQTAAEKKTD